MYVFTIIPQHAQLNQLNVQMCLQLLIIIHYNYYFKFSFDSCSSLLKMYLLPCNELFCGLVAQTTLYTF